MNICVIGAGYVGLVAASCLSEDNNVICVDKNIEKIEMLKKGDIPFYEPKLKEIITKNINKTLFFENDIALATKKSSVIFIAVGTPTKEDGDVDLSAVYEAIKEVATSIDDYKVIVQKSTVPMGTNEKILEIISKYTTNFDIVSNPEFLRQGSAVDDFINPDRIIIGSNSTSAIDIVSKIYSKNKSKIITMDLKSAEMTKYAANSFLALKISFANEIANICEKIGADYEMVKLGISKDERIGSQFINAGLGWGGSCFPKDVKALLKISSESDFDAKILKATQEVNAFQKDLFINKILNYFNGDIRNKIIAVWGLSFKPNTDDLREAPSIDIIHKLLEKGAKVKVYDPKAMNNFEKMFKDSVEYSKDLYNALNEADSLLLLTEWDEFKNPDFNKMKNIMKTPTIFDGRNQYNPIKLKKIGFKCFQIGRKDV